MSNYRACLQVGVHPSTGMRWRKDRYRKSPVTAMAAGIGWVTPLRHTWVATQWIPT